MTALSTADTLSAADRQEAARNAYVASVKAGNPLTGAELGRRFGRTDRWGRLQIRKFRTELGTGNPSGNGTAPNDGGSGTGNTDGTLDRARAAGRDRPAPSRLPTRTSTGTGTPVAVDRNPTVVPFTPPSGTATTGVPDDNASLTEPEPTGGGSAPPVPAAGTELGPEVPLAEPRPEGDPAETDRSWLDTVVTLTVAVVCAAASYGHMYHVALLAGEPLWIARAWPITVDGLVIAALRRGPDGRRWLALGIAVSMAANVLAQFPELAASAGPLVSAWPPVALYGTHRLVHGARHHPSPIEPPAG